MGLSVDSVSLTIGKGEEVELAVASLFTLSISDRSVTGINGGQDWESISISEPELCDEDLLIHSSPLEKLNCSGISVKGDGCRSGSRIIGDEVAVRVVVVLEEGVAGGISTRSVS